MKNLITLGLLVLAIPLFSQVEIRPMVGFNFSNVTKSPDGTSTQAKLGAQFGSHVMIGNRFHLNPGIAWFSRATEYSSSSDVDVDQTVQGVIIPLLVGYRFIDPTTEPFLNFRLFAGPSMMFFTKTEYNDGVLDEAVDWKQNQWGAQIGLGLDIAIFFVDAVYEFGLTNTHDGISEIEGVFDNFSEIKQNTFIVNAGVRLSFSR
jgi:hypothetical protein